MKIALQCLQGSFFFLPEQSFEGNFGSSRSPFVLLCWKSSQFIPKGIGVEFEASNVSLYAI